ncbi:MAG: tubulin--tyrosine ligase family protein [Pseudomonadales bacterium]|nr:tubulin--tyrosine ligase family protein [Pseudomonadales bacterium]
MIEIIGNRAVKLFNRAANQVHFDSSALIVYWDTYAGPLPDFDADAYQLVVQMLPRSATNPFDDKGRLGDIMLEHENLFPRTFSDIDEIPDSLADPNGMWFLKNRHGAGGTEVECVRLASVQNSELKQYSILQQAVKDVRLFENRKYTIRAYVLIWNGQVYLYKKWYRVVHGGIYSPDATDYSIQVSLRYSGGGTEFMPQFFDASEEEKGEFDALHRANKRLKTVFAPLIEESNRNSYSLLGCDFLIKESGDAILIEINAYPNLVHLDPGVANQVNFPMIQDTVRLLVTGEQPAQWLTL